MTRLNLNREDAKAQRKTWLVFLAAKLCVIPACFWRESNHSVQTNCQWLIWMPD